MGHGRTSSCVVCGSDECVPYRHAVIHVLGEQAAEEFSRVHARYDLRDVMRLPREAFFAWLRGTP